MADSIQIQILDGLYKALKKQIDYYSRDDLNLSNVPKDERVAILAELGTIHTRLSAFANSDMLLTLNDIETIKKDYEALISNIPSGSTYDDTEIKQKITALESFFTENDSKLNDLFLLNSKSKSIYSKLNFDLQTLVIYGDSITAGNGTDTLNTYSISNAQICYANAIAGHPFDIIYNAGVGRENSTQILARIQTDVIDKNPTHCMLLCGMNDATSSLHTNFDDTLISNIKTIYERLYANGIYLFLLTNTTTLHDLNKNKQAFKINSWMSSYFKDKLGVEIIDLCSAWIDSSSLNGYPNALMVRDNIHPSNVGGFYGGLEISKHFSKYKTKHLFPVSALDSYSINNRSLVLNHNPLMLGTSGIRQTVTDSGEVANEHFLFSSTGVTSIASKESRPDGFGEYQVLDVNSTTSGYSRFTVKSNYIPKSGDKIYMIAEVEIVSSTGLFNRLQGYLYMGIPSKTGCFGGYGTGENKSLVINTPTKMIYKTNIVEVTSDEISLYARIEPIFTGVGTAKIRIGRLSFIKVN